MSPSEPIAFQKTDVMASSLASDRNYRARWSAALALVLRRERQERELSQWEMSQRAGLHPTYISRLENGRLGISFPTLALCAEALGLPVAEIVSRAEAMIATEQQT